MRHADGGCTANCALDSAACAKSDVRAMYPTPQYAEWTRDDAMEDGQPVADEYAVETETGSLLPTGVRQLLWDLNLLEGIPDELINAYVREIMLRADQVRRTAAACRGPSNNNTYCGGRTPGSLAHNALPSLLLHRIGTVSCRLRSLRFGS